MEPNPRAPSLHVSHLHVSVLDLEAAVEWFRRVLALEPLLNEPGTAVFRFGEVDLAMHPDWGHGETSMTFALRSDDCRKDYQAAVARGATPRTPPRDKGDVIGADVQGPGRLVIEWEQVKR